MCLSELYHINCIRLLFDSKSGLIFEMLRSDSNTIWKWISWFFFSINHPLSQFWGQFWDVQTTFFEKTKSEASLQSHSKYLTWHLIYLIKFRINVWMVSPADPWCTISVMVLFSESCNLYVLWRLHFFNNPLQNRHKGDIRAYWCTSLGPSQFSVEYYSKMVAIFQWQHLMYLVEHRPEIFPSGIKLCKYFFKKMLKKI